MTRAVNLANIADSTILSVDAATDRVGIGSTQPTEKLEVVGVVSATSFFGDGSNLSGITAGATLSAASGAQRVVVTSLTSGTMTAAGTDADLAWNSTTNTLSATNISVGGTLTYEDVTNVDSIGVITARSGIVATGVVTASSGIVATGVITATSFEGSGANLSGLPASGIEVKSDGSSVGSALTAVNFSGATVSTGSAGITTVTIAAAGIVTNAYSGGLVTLDLSKDEHKVTATGITTLTVTGGTEGDTHIVRVINSGIATVGFSTFFLFPSGSVPSLPISDGAFSQISFQVNRVGAAGTQLFATAAVNFS